MQPIFAQPRSVIPLRDSSAYIALLDEFNVPYRGRWSEKTLNKRCAEVENHDVVYTTTYDFFPENDLARTYPNMPLRFLITMASWFKCEDRGERFVLVERQYDEETHSYIPRKYDGSGSEKGKLDPKTGLLTETCASTLVRLLDEEARIKISEDVLAAELAFQSWQSEDALIGGALYIEQDSRMKARELGVWNFNQIAHFYCSLPPETYFLGFRQDAETKYLSQWVSASENYKLEPIPAEFVLK